MIGAWWLALALGGPPGESSIAGAASPIPELSGPGAPSAASPAVGPAGGGGPPRGTAAPLGLGLLALGAGLAGTAAGRAGERLRPSGSAAVALAASRALGLLLAALLGGLAAMVAWPDELRGFGLFALIAGALAAGGTARDALRDAAAGAILAAEGGIRPGARLRGPGFAGRVVRTGLRAAWLQDARGGWVVLPNRRLLGAEVSIDPEAYPEVVVRVRSPLEDPSLARAALAEAALFSPWIAPGASPEVAADPADPGGWVVRARLLDHRFEDRFAGTLWERALESAAARRG